MGNALTELGTRFAMLKELKEHHEKMAKLISAELSKLGIDLFREFADTRQVSFRLLGTGVFADGRDRIVKPETEYSGTIVTPPEFFGYLRGEGHGSLVKENVHAATLKKWIKGQKKQNLPLPPETMLKVWTVETAKVTRAPKDANGKEESVGDSHEGDEE